MMKKSIFIVGFILCLSLSCNKEEAAPAQTQAPTPAPSGPDYSKLTPDCFSPYSTNPIIGPGNEFFTVDTGNNKRTSTWGDPHVLKVGGQFVMYASSLPNDRANDTVEHIAV
jgi:hypothetical protein